MAQNDVTAGILREHMDAYAALLESVSTADNTAGDWSEYPSSAEPTPGQSAKKRVPTLATGKKRRGKAASTKHSKQNDESSTTATDTEVSDADAASESRETPSKMAPPSAVANKKKSRSKKAVRGNVQAELPTPDATLIVKRRENRRSVASARVNYDERSSDDMEAYEAEQVIQ